MTIDDLIKQFKKEMVYKNGTYRHEPHILEDWLRTNLEAMIKDAVGESEAEDYYNGPDSSPNFDDKAIIRNELRASILQKLGIEK